MEMSDKSAFMAKNRVRELRKARRMTLDQMAEHTGMSTSYLSRIESGTRQLNEASAAKVASALKCTPANLMDNTYNLPINEQIDGMVTPSLELKVYIHGSIQAGHPMNIQEHPLDPAQFVTMPNDDRYPGIPKFALRVRGDSMDEVAPDGSVIICVKYIDLGCDPQDGEYVVVQHTDATGLTDATLKQYVRRDGQSYLVPKSSHPAHQAPIPFRDNGEDDATIIWARMVKVIRDY